MKGIVRYLSAGITGLLSLLLLVQPLKAQLTVVEGSAMSLTPQELVQNYLVGTGITISNATFNGSAPARHTGAGAASQRQSWLPPVCTT